jgi:hypothetical protein
MLFGLVLAGVPVLVHLIMRQKPKAIRFPAFRFLRQRHLTNRRKLRLQHLLLLLLRMVVIAGLCLALARPRLSGAPWALGERPVTAVLVFDTSPSMDYSVGGVSRLEEAKQKARELLEEMAEGSRVVVLDNGDEAAGDGPDRLPPGMVLARMSGLRTRPANGALNRTVEQAFRMLASAAEGEDPPPCFLYVFSDRTRACWDPAGLSLQRPDGVSAVFVDVGAETPKDLAIDAIDIEPIVAAPGAKVQVRVTVRATGSDFDTELTCRFDNEADPERSIERRQLRLSAGQAQVVVFDHQVPAKPPGGGSSGPLQVTASVATPDALPFNNVRHATFLVRERRKVLTVVQDDTQDSDLRPWLGWVTALNSAGSFQCEVQQANDFARMDDKDLRTYPVVCLFEIAPQPEVWEKLKRYVAEGGGLVVVPGGIDWGAIAGTFNREGKDLLPLSLRTISQVPPEGKAIPWEKFSPQHPLTRYFHNAAQGDVDFAKPSGWPKVYAYWETDVVGGAMVLARFTDKAHSAALAERLVGRGRVLQFTTPLDFRDLDRVRRWHNYWQLTSFGFVLVDQVCRYLAGDWVPPQLNFRCGQVVQLVVPSLAPPYTLQGPGLVLAEANLKPPGADGQLVAPQAANPGNFPVLDGKGRIATAFSMNVRAEESYLDRVPREEIEGVLGDNALLQVGRSISLKDALQGQRPPAVELLPYLMMAVLVFLTFEGLFANKFYRRTGQGVEPEPIAS